MINKKEVFSDEALISYMEICILIIATFSFSYIMYIREASDKFNQKQEDKLLSPVLNFLKVWIQRSKIGLASAACCENTKSNVKCQDTNDVSICSGDLLPASCSNIEACKQGCCIDNGEGTCAKNSLRASCSLGLWKDDANCNVIECRKGCCILPTQGESWYMTDKKCGMLSAFYGIKKDFKQVDEAACIKLQKNQNEGACLFAIGSEVGCKFTTRQECLKITNNINSFYNQTLCSSPGLNTKCEKEARTGCLQGRSEVYWFDSCGNRENIYSSDKTASWNNGYVLNKNNSCNPSNNNIENKDCGNCNSDKGSFCALSSLTRTKAAFGNYICKDMNCLYEGKTYLDGETWCDYKSFIGEGKDVVGSRNFKKTCDKGVVKTEPCEDFRQEICVEKTLDDKKTAQCRINRWRECLSVNSIEQEDENGNPISKGEIDAIKERRCMQNPDCDFRVMNIFDKPEERNIEADSAVRMCTPKYPPGLDFSSAFQEQNKEQCSYGNFNCTAYFLCGKCVANCNCLTREFTETLNDACISMGDCGAKANIEGEVTSGGYGLKFANKNITNKSNSKPPRLSAGYLLNLASYAVPVPEKVATEFLQGAKKNFVFKAILEAISVSEDSGSVFIPAFDKFESAVIGSFLGTMGYQYFGPAGWVYGLLIGYFIGDKIQEILSNIPVVGGIFGNEDCKLKKKVVSFSCLPWQAPLGGGDCGKCDDKTANGIPCSKYRCESLGAGCEFVNSGTGNEDCIWKNQSDATPPKINLGNLSFGLKFNGKDDGRAKIEQEDGNCLESFSSNSVDVQTDELAMCKYDFYDNLFDDMDNYIGDFYSLEHNLSLNFPSRDALVWELNITGEEINIEEINAILDNMTRDMQMHIKCRDRNGNEKMYQIRTCVSDTDTHEAKMVASNPSPNGFFPYNKTEIPLNIWLNEPVDCRISKEDKEYYEMTENMDCRTSLIDVGKFGWGCNTTIKNDGNRTFYIRCLDQPWKIINRNANSQSFVFDMGKSLTPLNISEISPSGNMVFGDSNITITLRARTSGGATGDALCSYSLEEGGDYYAFFNTGNREHTQTFDSIGEGGWNIKISCEDEAGNTANAIANFNINVDSRSPGITRAYKRDSNLHILTDEDGSCYLSYTGCEFDFANASVMSGIAKDHSTSWDSGNIYYIKCADIWGNTPLGCSMVAKPENIPEG